MGGIIDALLNLQKIERELVFIRGKLKARKHAVTVQETKIQKLNDDWTALHDQSLKKRSDCNNLEMDLKGREDHIAKARLLLNTAKTNKEYASILTQINTYKADNAKLEEQVLAAMQDVENIKAQAEAIKQQITQDEKHLEEIRASSGQEIARLESIQADLSQKRAEAARNVPSEALKIFERIAENYNGDAMAVIEVHGRKPPYDYICGGCFMSLNAEHSNALRTRDEVRTCNNCGRILHLEPEKQESKTS